MLTQTCLPVHIFPVSTEFGQQYRSTPVFLKIQTQSFQKVRKSQRERCKFVASEADCSALMGSYRLLTFAYFKPFPGLKYMAGPDWSKRFVKPMNINCIKTLQKLAIFLYMAGLNSKLLVISGCTKPTKRRKNARNQGNKL